MEKNETLWLELSSSPISVGEVYEWMPSSTCGAVVLFSGTTRDSTSEGERVDYLEYEAYGEFCLESFQKIADQIRQSWGSVFKVAMLHRVGKVSVAEPAVIVAVSAPHRKEAFAAATYGIDTLKKEAPIWKKEVGAKVSAWVSAKC